MCAMALMENTFRKDYLFIKLFNKNHKTENKMKKKI